MISTWKEGVNESLPRVSVVTVVFNAQLYIEETICSVLAQTYPNIEYIIVDGGSIDGTLDVIQKYRSRITFFSSEPDLGIYDAMNKGILFATGSWVNFMNSGDRFYSNESIAQSIAAFRLNATVLYGAVEVRYPQFKRLQMPGSLARLWAGMQFSHQSTFISLKYHKSNPYDLRFPITSDLHFMYRAYKSGQRFVRLDHVIASVMTGGVSEAHRFKTIWASGDAVADKGFRPLLRVVYLWQIFDAMLRTLAKRILPARLIHAIIRWK